MYRFKELTPQAQEVAMRLYNEAIPKEDQDKHDLEDGDMSLLFNEDGTPIDDSTLR